MGIVPDVLRSLSVAAWGLFVGAMLTEAFVLVPYWRSLPPNEFFTWYAANDRRLLGFIGPLTVVATLVVVAAALASLWTRHPGRWWALLAAVLTVVVVLMFPLYFAKANANFAAAKINPADLPTRLARWATWHGVRTGLSFAALAATLMSLRGVP